MRPIVHTYAPFLVERPFEQIKLDFGHQDVGAVLVSIGASYDGADGGPHAPGAGRRRAAVDTLPGWTIHVPGHPDEVERVLRERARGDDRDYMRLSEETNARRSHGRRSPRACGAAPGAAPLVVAVGPMLDAVLAATAGLDVTVPTRHRAARSTRDGLRGARARQPTWCWSSPTWPAPRRAWSPRRSRDLPHRLLALGVGRPSCAATAPAPTTARAHGLDAAGHPRARWTGPPAARLEVERVDARRVVREPCVRSSPQT